MFTGLKWATAGYGIGALYVNQKWLAPNNFPFAGWRSVEVPENMNNTAMQLKNEASVIESGCPHFPNIFALGGALNLFTKIGQENISQRVIELNRILENELGQLGIEVIAQHEDKHRSGILIAKLPHPKTVLARLAEKNIIVSARGQGVRISSSIFNNEEDIKTLIAALQEIL
jgi:selenocysteine lyase/cysteine desulfurase